MSHCYLITGVISFKPLIGAQGETELLYAGSMLGIFTWSLTLPNKTVHLQWGNEDRINNLPKVTQPVSQARIEPQVHLTCLYSPQTKNREKSNCSVCEKEGGVLERLSISQLHHVCRIARLHPLCNNLQPLVWVPLRNQAIFLKKWLSLYPPRIILWAHYLKSLLNDTGCK